MSMFREAISRTSSVSRILWNGTGNNWKQVSSAEIQNLSRSLCSPHKNTNFCNSKLKSLPLQDSLSNFPILNTQSDRLYVTNIFNKPQIRIELPISSIVENFKLPPVRDVIITNNTVPQPVEAPSQANIAEKQAARLIVIRRQKMKKHKLRKLRIKMKYEWAKVRQRREMRKEKAFQAQLIAQIKDAEKFDAETYVAGRIAKAHELENLNNSIRKTRPKL
ncbi:hypothetical protein L9F63_023271 [Diploptera punctata]|uniref:Ribosomal protein mS38 C-terminal domain-containing protein n=1 Tax=Diploptera punctata TaxID=6984 RepID=A0AAD7ZJK1_DIPPU|nr:hypothetical protein L9F63_023271 [Diploptera punctata]